MANQLTERELLRIQVRIGNTLYGKSRVTRAQWKVCHDAAVAVAQELEHQGHLKLDYHEFGKKQTTQANNE